MNEQKIFEKIQQNPSCIDFFKGKQLIAFKYFIDDKHQVDFVFKDDSSYYLVDLRHKSLDISVIEEIREMVGLYGEKQGLPLNSIKGVVLLDEESYSMQKIELEKWASENDVIIISYKPEVILGGEAHYPCIEGNFEAMFRGYTPKIDAPLTLLKNSSGDAVVLGRTASEQSKYGDRGTLYIGRICEKTEGYFGLKVLVDAVHPHKIFICGKTGSGKSYTLGVLAEELASLDINIGVIIVDPMGIFWSMKFPCSEWDAETLKAWGLQSKGFLNVKVFVPIGYYDKAPEGTRDEIFAIRPSELTVEDWCNTFGISIYESPQAALLSEIIEKLNKGYIAELDGNNRVVPPNENYTINDMLECAKCCSEFVKRYRSDTIRALINHLESAKSWGIFSDKGTPIQLLSVPNQVSVIDVSFLPDFLRALVVGVIARKVLEERTKFVRHVKASEVQRTGIRESSAIQGIPTTWLIIDEAHMLAPAKGKTAASEALVEYAKRGRMPGCALVLSTQQPSATDDRILSQVDILITHNLSFSDDISSYRARAPSLLPPELCEQGFIRKLPVGAAVIADQSMTTERAFVIFIRPRVSEHAGRVIPPETFKVTAPTVVETPEATALKIEATVAVPSIPTLYVPANIASDYLSRLIQYRFIDFLQPLNEKRFTRSLNLTWPHVRRDILSVVLGHLNRLGLESFEIRSVNETPVIMFLKGDVRVVLAACVTESETIMVVFLSASVEQNLEKYYSILNKISKEI
ncbi:MAG: ATP-binding protein [Nitrososphaeria archaeon]